MSTVRLKPLCMQAWSAAALLLVEQVRRQPHQEVGVRAPGAGCHAPAEERDPGQGAAASHQGAVRRCAGAAPQVDSQSGHLSGQTVV